MKAWFLGLNMRERRLVAFGGVVLALMMIYLLLIEPLSTGLQERRDQLRGQQDLLAWMQTSAQQVQQLKASGAQSGGASSSKPPYLLLDEAIRRANMPAPARLEPQGADGTVAQFEGVAFDGLMRMLAELQSRTDLRVTELSVARREQELVSATVTLKRGGE